MSLKKYLEQANAYRSIFGKPEYDLRKAEDRKALADRIDGDLSPENLTCDGELSRSAVQARYKVLVAAATDLKKLDPSVSIYELTL